MTSPKSQMSQGSIKHSIQYPDVAHNAETVWTISRRQIWVDSSVTLLNIHTARLRQLGHVHWTEWTNGITFAVHLHKVKARSQHKIWIIYLTEKQHFSGLLLGNKTF